MCKLMKQVGLKVKRMQDDKEEESALTNKKRKQLEMRFEKLETDTYISYKLIFLKMRRWKWGGWWQKQENRGTPLQQIWMHLMSNLSGKGLIFVHLSGYCFHAMIEQVSDEIQIQNY